MTGLLILYLLKRVLQLYNHSSDVALEREGEATWLPRHRVSTELTRLAAPRVAGRGIGVGGTALKIHRTWQVHLIGMAVNRPIQLFL